MRFIFGGTSEGRQLAEQYVSEGENVVVCVASSYGRELLPSEAVVYDHPMELPEMTEAVKRHAPKELIDATHPFAVRVSRNIRACADQLGVRYVRIERPVGDEDWRAHVRWAKDADEAAAMLASEQGAILLTTGTNTLAVYAAVIDPARIYVRVLPTHEALDKCRAAGVMPSRIVAMQGPFTTELNRALYSQLGVRHVVTKDSGEAGGLPEKVLPALSMGLNVIVIERPKE